MLDRVIAVEVIREAKSGLTKPVLMLCETDTDGAIKVFCKLSAGCFEGMTSLAREVVAAYMGFMFRCGNTNTHHSRRPHQHSDAPGLRVSMARRRLRDRSP